MKSLRGHLLVASPHLLDSNFCRTVVLLAQHGPGGAFGLVLNRPTGKTLKELWGEVSQTPCDSDQPVYLGGPVPGPLMALHGQESLADTQVLPGLYLSLETGKLEQIVTWKGGPLKVFVGHAAWAGGQLEGELKAGGWLTDPATLEQVFGDDTDLWRRVAKQIGDSMLLPVFKVRRVPTDSSLN